MIVSSEALIETLSTHGKPESAAASFAASTPPSCRGAPEDDELDEDELDEDVELADEDAVCPPEELLVEDEALDDTETADDPDEVPASSLVVAP